jgi:ABC-type multidrug transport system fused ATPase/permease subunit
MRHWGTALPVAAFTLSGPLVAGALLWLSAQLIDDVFIGKQMDLLPTIGALYVAVLIAKLSLDFFEMRLEATVVEQIGQDVRVDAYRHLFSLSPGSLGKRGVGDQLAHLSEDVDRVEHIVFTGLLAILADIVGAVFFLGFLLFLSWKLTLCALLVVPFLVLVSVRLAPRVRRAAKITRRDETAWMSLAEERLGATPLVHAFGAQSLETESFARRCARARRSELRTVTIQAWLSLFVEATAAIGGLLVIGLGAYDIHSGALTVGTFVAFLGAVGSLYGPARGLAKAPGRFQRAAVGAKRVADLLDTRSLVEERPSAKPLTNVKGALEFKDVHFAYTPGAEVLRGISLRIEPGETVAVVGPSGSGKSTLVRLALRLYDATAGAVLVDGVDLRDATLESLKRTVGVVFQEPYAFSGSITENIRYGQHDASNEQVTAAARAAHIHAFAEAQPGGYSTLVGPRGGWLSGGQRQRLAVARALLREPPILLLDEATASVDSETDELIQDALERLSGQCTIMIIAHRLSSVRRADRVVVLDGGRIVESGTPEALLKPATRYHDLFAAQLVQASAA